MALQIDEDGNIYDDGVQGAGGNEYPVTSVYIPDYTDLATQYSGEAPIDSGETPDFFGLIGINPDTTMENWKSPSNQQIESALQGDATFSGLLKQFGNKALDLVKTNGAYDPLKLAKLGMGAYAASRPNNAAPTGYQGKIPKYTAERTMLNAPPVGRRPGSGGIDYGGGVTYKKPTGEVASSNERTLDELRQAAESNPFNRPATYERPVVAAAKGGLVSDGFVVPADVVSHLGNGSSEAGLKLLAARFDATPIKGEGDGMSDSIPTTIGGKQEARVANDEAFISPEMVKRIGGGDAEKGAKKLYAMMDRVQKARSKTVGKGKVAKNTRAEKYLPA
jgi:hypothetical protein